jgi:hypothetical protein
VCAQAQRAALPSSQSLAGRSSEGGVSPFRPSPGLGCGRSPALERDYFDTHRMLLVEQARAGEPRRARHRYTYDVYCWSWNITQRKLLVHLPPREAKLTGDGVRSGSTGTDLEPLNIVGAAVGTGSTGLRARRLRYRGPLPRPVQRIDGVWSACPLRTDALPTTLFRWRSMPKGVGWAATDGDPSKRRLSASRVAR